MDYYFVILKLHVIFADKPIFMKVKQDAPGMKGQRSRNQDGELRQKRSDTHMGTIENQYGRDFDVRSDMNLGTFLKENNLNSLNDVIHSKLGQ
ncbi:MAG: hypothetical protein IM581_15070 [Chitinophagaceae bacterium]|nr:hypothetical protein [Chitinophagaceae bacterium]